MGLRETIDRKPHLAAGIGGGLIVVGIVAVALQLRAGGPPEPSDRAFYSTDDGQSWFEESIGKLPPFTHDGKEAFRAYVYQCNGGKPFVSHLERFTPEGRKAVESAGAKDAVSLARVAAANPKGPMWGKEVKRPGSNQWVAADNLAKASPIMSPRCPEGPGQATPVEP
jgi:hypothetical protein